MAEQHKEYVGDALIGRVEGKLFQGMKLGRLMQRPVTRTFTAHNGFIVEHKEKGATDVRPNRRYPLRHSTYEVRGTELDISLEIEAADGGENRIQRTIQFESMEGLYEFLGYLNYTKQGGFEKARDSKDYPQERKQRLKTWLEGVLEYALDQLNCGGEGRRGTMKAADMKGQTLTEAQLEFAAESANLALLDWFIRTLQGEKLDERPSEAAVRSDPVLQEVARFEYLLEVALAVYGPQLVTGSRTACENTLLHLATKADDTELVNLLLDHSQADVNARGTEMYTPLTYALKYKLWDLARLLVDRGACVNATFLHKPSVLKFQEEGQTVVEGRVVKNKKNALRVNDALRKHLTQGSVAPFLMACKSGLAPASLLKRMVNKGADLSAEDENGMNGLMICCKRGHLEAAVQMINQGVDVNRKSKQTGQTALHCAVACMELDQRKPLVKLLIEHGANPLRSDFNGRSALDVARERQLYGEVQYLEGVIEERGFQADPEDERARLHRTSSVPVSRTGSAGGSAEWLGGPSASFEVRERETKRTERTLSLPEGAQIPAQAAEARDRPAGRAQ
uniref:Uncharacterized protein n=1 Tax=Chromera velia CCMP2878 TaxID=1169474 RepID=A0A0G4G865_9ALVE|mmetsp:Transcript_15818/g.32077  ORF Transcript_15818/g.32077 Transcript_15818/m.32077 type:complete len:566 (-) Transcript_15818:673-2370(-)|eukprot:Cvel_20729.t1-p1 / transcript=Cvel_20729.t1 / gene=Cvel_20729 / organism=Chromera_velia_CCMP2878 / gene_product=Ankyrin-1, putative / transcript_product=Ankyrin-1, putative / location=Cvel_scaffold1887:19075-24657(+) / protein_length=565 / sequence_SO=supercontig / SO=protein_coding / is_pseudo=false